MWDPAGETRHVVEPFTISRPCAGCLAKEAVSPFEIKIVLLMRKVLYAKPIPLAFSAAALCSNRSPEE
jgi:hypothetical protein